MKNYTKTFPSGLRLVFHKQERTRPAHFYLIVRAGSVDETPAQNGIAHFVEHMNFKGTGKLNYSDITKLFEQNGIITNAVTNETTTSYFASTLPEKMELTFDTFSQMIFESVYDAKELKKERQVIYKEMDMTKDNPSYLAYIAFKKNFFAGTPFEKLIIGSKKTLKNITRDDITNFVKTHYTPDKMVLSVTGPFKFSQVIKWTQKYINSRFKDNVPCAPAEYDQSQNLLPKKKFCFVKKDVKQTRVILAFPTKNVFDKNFPASTIYTFILSGAASSRLYVKLREQNGLVYSIECDNDRNYLSGYNIITFGTSENNVKQAVGLIKREIDKFVKEGVSEEELNMVKTLHKSIVLKINEVSMNITRSNAADLSLYGKIIPVEDKIKQIEALTKEQVNDEIKKGFDYSHMVAVVTSKTPDKTLFDVFN